MKKWLKFIALTLITIFVFSCTACQMPPDDSGNNNEPGTEQGGQQGGSQGGQQGGQQGGGQEGGEEEVYITLPNDPNARNVGTMADGNVMLCNFEDYKPNINIAGFMNGFGKLSLNTNKKYVSRGEASCRLDPLGWAGSGALPLVYFPTKSDLYSYNYTDFSYVDYITFDIYSDNAKEVTMKAGFIKSLIGIDGVTRVNEQEIVLQPGWNKDCAIFVDAPILALTADITSLIGVYFMFENAGSLDVVESNNPEERTPRFYLDNVVMVKKAEKNSANVQLTLKTNEILDFELLYQKYMVTNDNPSTMEVVNATDYGLVARSGKRILRVVLNGTNSGYWKLFRILDKLVQKTVLKGMSTTTAKKAYVCMEIYNNHTETTNLCVDYTLASNNKSFLSTTNNCLPKQWTHYEYCVNDILKVSPTFLSNPGEITINYADNCEVDREYFFDNIRVEIR